MVIPSSPCEKTVIYLLTGDSQVFCMLWYMILPTPILLRICQKDLFPRGLWTPRGLNVPLKGQASLVREAQMVFRFRDSSRDVFLSSTQARSGRGAWLWYLVTNYQQPENPSFGLGRTSRREMQFHEPMFGCHWDCTTVIPYQVLRGSSHYFPSA